MLIVESGARADLGQRDAAVITLQLGLLDNHSGAPWVARLRSAYADALAAVGRDAEARHWLERAAEADPDDVTGSDERLAELDGLAPTDLEDEDEEEDEDSRTRPGATCPPTSRGATVTTTADATIVLVGVAATGARPRRRAARPRRRGLRRPRRRTPGGSRHRGRRGPRHEMRLRHEQRRPHPGGGRRAPAGARRAGRGGRRRHHSAQLAAGILAGRLAPGSPVLVVGGEGLHAALRAEGRSR